MARCGYGTCDITSGRITTRGSFSQTYGRFEARMRVPYGQGTWPAFWMLGDTAGQPNWPTSGEIDIMEEVGSDPQTVDGTIHGPGFVDNGIERRTTLPGRAVLADGFHTYGVEWSPSAITWTLDGKSYGTVHRATLTSTQRWVFDHGFYLLLNLAIGGAMPGPPDARTPFPSTLLVDSVRVYKAVGATSTTS